MKLKKQAERIAELEAMFKPQWTRKRFKMLFEVGITADETVLDFMYATMQKIRQTVASLIGLVNNFGDAKVQTIQLSGARKTNQDSLLCRLSR